MRTLVLPGMDGGAELSEGFRRHLGADTEALSYPCDQVLDYGSLEERVRARLAESPMPTTLIAESFSGPIAISIAASPPPNLKRLVLVATFDHPPAPSFLAPLVRAALFRRPPPAFFVRQRMLGKDAIASDVQNVQDAVRRVDASVIAARLKSVLRVDVRDNADAIQLPVLSLHASKHRLVSRPLARPGWHSEAVDGPHLLLKQRPRPCAEAIRRFARS